MSGHADKALAERRKAQSVALAAAGCDYDTIAREVGYTSRGTAWATVMKALREHTAEGVDELRATEGDRLDALQARIWDEAMAGNVAAINAAVRIVELRCRLFGLHRTVGASSAARSVVITE